MNEQKQSIKGVVLAGGEGKRLRPLTYYFQKCMIPLGNMQKPLLEYIIRLFKYHGVTNISLLVGYKYEQIINYFNSGERFGVDINYVLDNPHLKGSGGSLLNAYQRGFLKTDQHILVYYGDIISNISLTEMLKQHRERDAKATLALASEHQISVGVAEVNEGKITSWAEKPKLEIDVGIGIMILNGSVLPELENLSKSYKELDIMTHLIPQLIKNRESVQAYSTRAFWYDVGSTEQYEKFDNNLLEKYFEYLFIDKNHKPFTAPT